MTNWLRSNFGNVFSMGFQSAVTKRPVSSVGSARRTAATMAESKE